MESETSGCVNVENDAERGLEYVYEKWILEMKSLNLNELKLRFDKIHVRNNLLVELPFPLSYKGSW